MTAIAAHFDTLTLPQAVALAAAAAVAAWIVTSIVRDITTTIGSIAHGRRHLDDTDTTLAEISRVLQSFHDEAGGTLQDIDTTLRNIEHAVTPDA